MTRTFALTLIGLFSAVAICNAQAPTLEKVKALPLAAGVRGLVTRTPGKIIIDGKLREWSEAFCTPVHYAHGRINDRAAQFFTMWDDDAFYIGLRALDTKQANPGQPASLWNGDSVEFYLDTRLGAGLRGKDWTDGAIHFYFTPFDGNLVRPRWVMRRGIATSQVVLKGTEIAATATKEGYEVEFKIPWSNFPGFTPKLGALIAADAELCSGDGGGRTDRTFAYGSPLSVQQPASQAALQLVKSFDPDYLSAVGPATFPMWVDTPWVQPARAQALAVVAIPPAFVEIVGMVEVRLHDADGKVLKTLQARLEPFGPKDWGFLRAVAQWSIDDFAPGAYFASAKVSTRTGKTLTTVTPRMVSEANISGR